MKRFVSLLMVLFLLGGCTAIAKTRDEIEFNYLAWGMSWKEIKRLLPYNDIDVSKAIVEDWDLSDFFNKKITDCKGKIITFKDWNTLGGYKPEHVQLYFLPVIVDNKLVFDEEHSQLYQAYAKIDAKVLKNHAYEDLVTKLCILYGDKWFEEEAYKDDRYSTGWLAAWHDEDFNFVTVTYSKDREDLNLVEAEKWFTIWLRYCSGMDKESFAKQIERFDLNLPPITDINGL